MNTRTIAALVAAFTFAGSTLNANAASCTTTRPDVKLQSITVTRLNKTQAYVVVELMNIGQAQPPLGSGIGPQSVYLYQSSRWLGGTDIPSLAAGDMYRADFIVPLPIGPAPYTAFYVPEPDSAALLDCDGSNNSLSSPLR